MSRKVKKMQDLFSMMDFEEKSVVEESYNETLIDDKENLIPEQQILDNKNTENNSDKMEQKEYKTYSVEEFDGEFNFIIRANELGIGEMYRFEVVGEREENFLPQLLDLPDIPKVLGKTCHVENDVSALVGPRCLFGDGYGAAGSFDLGTSRRAKSVSRDLECLRDVS